MVRSIHNQHKWLGNGGVLSHDGSAGGRSAIEDLGKGAGSLLLLAVTLRILRWAGQLFEGMTKCATNGWPEVGKAMSVVGKGGFKG